MQFDPGDVVLVPFPFTDLTAKRTRPALIVSSSAYNKAVADVVVCGITSNLANSAHSVLVTQADLASGTLPLTSRVKADKIATLQKTIVRRKLGRVKPAILSQTVKEMSAILGGGP